MEYFKQTLLTIMEKFWQYYLEPSLLCNGHTVRQPVFLCVQYRRIISVALAFLNTYWMVLTDLLDFGCWALSPRLIPRGLNIFCWIKIRTCMSFEQAWKASAASKGVEILPQASFTIHLLDCKCIEINSIDCKCIGWKEFSLVWGGRREELGGRGGRTVQT